MLEQLLAAYDTPERGYHNLEHLREVLERVDEIVAAEPDRPVDLDPVRLAAFFHDAVYRIDPDDGTSNEEASARWVQDALATRLPEADVRRVAELVRATHDHRAAPDDHAAGVLMDADLAILAAPSDRYARYVEGVRHEYASVAEPEFRIGRAQVLTDLVEREHLFHTAYGRSTWEEPARANIAAEVRDLTS
jgi:predicted metal-dependent HD superfamily phosphohydrolase